MKVIHLNRNDFFLKNTRTCFYCKLKNLKTIWLFNCGEGCQQYLMKQKIKISQVSKIIITELTICNISGLPGLLSSLSLSNKKSAVHLYGPTDLAKYLELAKKYSKTNFRYNLYFHPLKTNFIIKDHQYQIYCLKKFIYFEFIITIPKNKGKFQLNHAKQWQIEVGPLYGKLKQGYDFVLPDGTTVNSKNFTEKDKKVNQISLLFSQEILATRQIRYWKTLALKTMI
uniref:tRNase Z endonuclease domain-containing protein n=1 Tax=Gracilaria salicornia TaxID=172968 RepID=W8DXC8_9FLOR|nr:hypothetical protein [Gracilaria salicornia]AHH24503.1 hypothetical protein [Gracilaria salicornia]UAD87521.1 ribonuclease Z [Gracilaria salicornia]